MKPLVSFSAIILLLAGASEAVHQQRYRRSIRPRELRARNGGHVLFPRGLRLASSPQEYGHVEDMMEKGNLQHHGSEAEYARMLDAMEKGQHLEPPAFNSAKQRRRQQRTQEEEHAQKLDGMEKGQLSGPGAFGFGGDRRGSMKLQRRAIIGKGFLPKGFPRRGPPSGSGSSAKSFGSSLSAASKWVSKKLGFSPRPKHSASLQHSITSSTHTDSSQSKHLDIWNKKHGNGGTAFLTTPFAPHNQLPQMMDVSHHPGYQPKPQNSFKGT